METTCGGSGMNNFECPRCGHCCQSEVSLRAMKHIKTWSERCEEHPDHQERIISERMIQERMQEEIDELRQALETEQKTAVSPGEGTGFNYFRASAITVLRQAQEPVAWISDSPTKGNGKQLHWTKAEAWRWSSNITPLYTAPPKREWVGLTADEIWECNKAKSGAVEFHICYEHQNVEDFAEAIEAKLKEKNT